MTHAVLSRGFQLTTGQAVAQSCRPFFFWPTLKTVVVFFVFPWLMPALAEGDVLGELATLPGGFGRLLVLQLLRAILHVSTDQLDEHLITAVLISFLAQDVNLALHYLNAKRPVQSPYASFSLEEVLVIVWDDLLEDDTFALHCLVELVLPAGPLMLKAERFVMESVLVRRIMDAGRRGVTMPLDQVIEQFLSLWLQRTSCHGMEAWLTRLAYHENTRRKFGVHLRSVWNLHWGSLRTITCVDPDIGQRKASGGQNGFVEYRRDCCIGVREGVNSLTTNADNNLRILRTISRGHHLLAVDPLGCDGSSGRARIRILEHG